MKMFLLVCLAFCSLGLSRSGATTVDFTGIDLATVESAAGQDFTYTVPGSTTPETLNVRLDSGSASSLTVGQTPDTRGFYVGQTAPDLNTAPPSSYFLFTLESPEAFTITQNETLTGFETNSFSLIPFGSGSWTVLSSSNVVQTGNGSNFVSFQGATPRDGMPYGNYSIGATGDTFEFGVIDAAGLINYGSAISLDIVPEPGPAWFLVGGGLIVWLGRRRAGRAR